VGIGYPLANPTVVRSLAVLGEPEREVVLTIGKPRPQSDPCQGF
jgi:hypothetical protein